MLLSRGQVKKVWISITWNQSCTILLFPVCQRLLGVRLGKLRTLETELTLSMMRPAGREQIKRIEDKIRYSNQCSRLLTLFYCCPAGHQKGKCGL